MRCIVAAILAAASLGVTGCGAVLSNSSSGLVRTGGNKPVKRQGGPRVKNTVGRYKAPPVTAVPLSAVERRLRDHATSEYERMVALLEETVNVSTGTGEPEGIRRAVERYGHELEPLGFRLEWVEPTDEQRERWRTLEQRLGGGHLVARRAGARADSPRVLLLGHVDTVFAHADGFRRFERQEDKATGPGVLDMKGGIVVLIHVLRALRAADLLDRAHFTVVLNSDEETGSLLSRSIIQREAAEADLALVFEGSENGDLTISRGGQGRFRIRVTGRAADVDRMERGVDAIHEMAHKIIQLKRLQRIDRGVTVNVSPLRGGVSRVRVADSAECELDLRYRTKATGEDLFRRIRAIANRTYVRTAGTRAPARTELIGLLHRPPMARTPDSARIAQFFLSASASLGKPRRLADAIGGSDANLTADLGVPTLDGLGPIGGGAHTSGEFVLLPSLVERTAVVAIGLSRLIARPPALIVQRRTRRQATGGGGER